MPRLALITSTYIYNERFIPVKFFQLSVRMWIWVGPTLMKSSHHKHGLYPKVYISMFCHNSVTSPAYKVCSLYNEPALKQNVGLCLWWNNDTIAVLLETSNWYHHHLLYYAKAWLRFQKLNRKNGIKKCSCIFDNWKFRPSSSGKY